MLLVSATCASAQPANRLGPIVDELGRAGSKAAAAERLFKAERDGPPKASKAEMAGAFAQLRQATQTFLDLAPKSFVLDALDLTRDNFRGMNQKAPSTLLEAVDECERRRDLLLASLLADRVESNLAAVVEDRQAETALGVTRDNPTLYGAVVVPRRPVDLLRNIRFAMDHDVVLRRDFYTEQNMRRFFAAPYAPIHRQTDGETWAIWAIRFDGGADPAPANWQTQRCEYQVRLVPPIHRNRSGFAGIWCSAKSDLSPTFPDVEAMFGREWQDVWQRPVVHGLPPPVTSPYGNRHISYPFVKPNARGALTVRFDPDGIFGSLEVLEEER